MRLIASAAPALAAILPKCPLCFVAIASAAGLNLSTASLLPIVAACLAVSLAFITHAALTTGRKALLVPAALAAALVIAARMHGVPPVTGYAGALLLGATALTCGKRAACRLPCGPG